MVRVYGEGAGCISWGFGTMDEMFEILTLVQTRKIAKKITIILYGTAFWKEVINFDALVKYGTISPEDMNLFQFADTPEAALEILQRNLTEQIGTPEAEVPAIAPSVKPDEPIATKEQVPDRSKE